MCDDDFEQWLYEEKVGFAWDTYFKDAPYWERKRDPKKFYEYILKEFPIDVKDGKLVFVFPTDDGREATVELEYEIIEELVEMFNKEVKEYDYYAE